MKRQKAQGWGPGEEAEQHYLVQPRALAGGGDLRHVSEFLRASGWQDRSRRNGPLVLDSPDRTIRIGYNPHVLPGGWTIHSKATAHQEAWTVSLGRQTPVEIVAGLTDALTRPRAAHAPDVWAPLREQRWKPSRRDGYFGATSPDGAAWMQFRHDPDGQALWWSGARDEQGNGWNATFTATTPMHLVQAFSDALASPEPVMRPRGRVPFSARIRTTSVSVLPSQLGAWQQARVHAARAATWARGAQASGRPRTTARPYTNPGARARR
ncbi:DUF317 domain-containing protein [Streptomyces griseiscabiei]|uniref:DUF317 domain-containing protein n=1 Tax=Streptomyces griseiscabiei TaxID=2993540 RepID=A0ABU4KXL2_9ACTN|nr:DUF317 domain-containing protein [Streptomyces griseiscabiei]MBZ3904420.1 DUF317 domain-containing protein [Streptomyces griseiscabiei]MDX2908167.1 DUF317 domain-containing protein [Streptomyces griseiscabiei]